jgi:tRNA-splicing ligase RtcB
MRVPARIFASEKFLNDIFKDRSVEQLVNVATLPGIQKWALAMPDIHEGYGFPIGGVAAMDAKAGVISPGGIGYDINCGVRILRTDKSYKEISAGGGSSSGGKNRILDLATAIYDEVPSGVGRGGRWKLSTKELDEVLLKGVDKALELGYAEPLDKEFCEANGRLVDADPDQVSKTAKDRGRDQLGTIGAGNHFVEIGRVDEIYDQEAAKTMGLFKDQITIMIHCGSRGLGHQTATDYIRIMMNAMPKYKINIPDPELACAPFDSKEGQDYWKAMSASANFAWANRQFITWEVREAWQKVFGKSQRANNEELKLIYDVAHNLAKLEEYPTQTNTDKTQINADDTQIGADNNQRKSALLVVHRKGATRSFPEQPVLIPGSMGTESYILVGDQKSIETSFGSSCHGAGRMMSRTKAKKTVRGSDLKQELERAGIAIRAGSMAGLAEEAPIAYKDVGMVVDIVHGAGLANKVAKIKPVGVIKG